MKTIYLFSFIALVIVAGCVGQSGTNNTSNAGEVKFSTFKEAYDSNLRLRCESGSSAATTVFYFAEGNVRVESSAAGNFVYQVITKDDNYYSWSSNQQGATSLQGDTAIRARNALYPIPFTSITCNQQSVSASMFQPPSQ